VGKSTSRPALSLVFFRHSNSPILLPFRPASKREASGVPDQLLERVLSLAVYPEELTYICELCDRDGPSGDVKPSDKAYSDHILIIRKYLYLRIISSRKELRRVTDKITNSGRQYQPAA
jgi:hypothetical protein